MPDKTIEELPLLDRSDFNQSTDYIIVQKPDGATYKMLVGHALTDVSSGDIYVDTKSVTLSKSQTKTVEFNALNLLSPNSAWKIDIFPKISLSSISRNKHGGEMGITSAKTLVKQAGSNKINSTAIGGTFFENVTTWNNYADYNNSYRTGVKTASVSVTVDSSHDENRLLISFSFSRTNDSTVEEVEVYASIFANLKT